MSNVKIALKSLSMFEGGYVNDKDDPGGETYRGIARNFHPEWPGWTRIDQINNLNTDKTMMKEVIETDDLLTQWSELLYKTRYWDTFQGDRINDQVLCNELFECGVILGTHRPIIFLQQSLNIMNRNGELFPDITVDGVMGPKTFSALFLINPKDHEDLLILINHFQRQAFIDACQKNPVKEKYIRGWLERTKDQ